MYTDFVEFKAEPPRHRRTSAMVAVTAGFVVAFAGGWATAPHSAQQVPEVARRVAPLAEPAAAQIEQVRESCLPRPTPSFNLAQRLQPMSADATEAWLLALRPRPAMH